MNIIFAEVDKRFIEAMVDGGSYINATELVRDAVRRMREEEDRKYERLMKALEAGEQSLREHGGKLYTPELLEQIDREAVRRAAEGWEPNPDVCP